ncbi:MAG: hypothetical protein ACHQWU_09115 [Gemmatimonadales bacterium]
MRSGALLCVFLAACGTAPPAETQVVVRPPPAPRRPFCAFDMAQPEPLAGALAGYFGPGIDCVPPEGGDAFTLGFGLHSDVYVLTVERTAIRLGDSMPFVGAAHLFATVGDAPACVDWRGEVVIDGDLPAWSVYIDATCSDAPNIRLQGQFWGWPMQ